MGRGCITPFSCPVYTKTSFLIKAKEGEKQHYWFLFKLLPSQEKEGPDTLWNTDANLDLSTLMKLKEWLKLFQLTQTKIWGNVAKP